MRSNIYLVAMFFLLVLSCTKDKEIWLNENNLNGIWFREDYLEQYSRISRLEYNFNGDNALEITRIEVDYTSKDTLGYRYRALGKYKVSEDRISFIDMSSYTNDDRQGSYTELDNLKLVSVGGNSTVSYRLEDNGNKIILIYPPCGPLENCIGSETLLRDTNSDRPN